MSFLFFKVYGVSFSREGTYFVTVGNRHIKFWYLTVSALMETVPLKSRAAILGDMKNNCFCDVACGSEENSSITYALTTNGLLCEFNEQRNLSRYIELKTERAYCIYADNYHLFIGCSNGTIIIFAQSNLRFIASLPRPHNLGVDIARGTDTRHLVESLNKSDSKYPDCVALCYDKYEAILTAIYNDHSFYVWDIKDFEKVKKLDSHLFHASKCWSLDVYSSGSHVSSLPQDSFITCSEDNTLRVWATLSLSSPLASQSKLKRNIYSKDLLKIIYIDNDLSNLCEVDESPENSDSVANNSVAKHFDLMTTANSSANNNPLSGGMDNSSLVKMGARCLKINPNGSHLATGDRNGNIRIYDLNTLETISMIEAHDGEVLYLQYSQTESGRLLLASSSRDRLIHIFDASKPTYDLLQTLGNNLKYFDSVSRKPCNFI